MKPSTEEIAMMKRRGWRWDGESFRAGYPLWVCVRMCEPISPADPHVWTCEGGLYDRKGIAPGPALMTLTQAVSMAEGWLRDVVKPIAPMLTCAAAAKGASNVC